MLLQGGDDALARDDAAQPPRAVQHRKLPLGGAEQEVGRRAALDCGPSVAKVVTIASRRQSPARDVARLHEPRFAGRGEEDEDRDEDEQRIAEQSEETEADCNHLADAGGELGRLNVAQAIASSARRTRPPSIGKAGMRLKRTSGRWPRQIVRRDRFRPLQLGELARDRCPCPKRAQPIEDGRNDQH